jgi:hypothetical protein
VLTRLVATAVIAGASAAAAADQNDTDAVVKRHEEIIRESQELRAKLAATPPVPIERPTGADCVGVYLAAIDLVDTGKLTATDFPNLPAKRDKAKAVVTKTLEKEGFDAELIEWHFLSAHDNYSVRLANPQGDPIVAPGFVDSRVDYCDTQFP